MEAASYSTAFCAASQPREFQRVRWTIPKKEPYCTWKKPESCHQVSWTRIPEHRFAYRTQMLPRPLWELTWSGPQAQPGNTLCLFLPRCPGCVPRIYRKSRSCQGTTVLPKLWAFLKFSILSVYRCSFRLDQATTLWKNNFCYVCFVWRTPAR